METLRNSRDFKKVVESGTREILENFTVYLLPNPEGRTRIGISVSRKAGGSVRRNRIKRRLREALRKNASFLPPGTDLVIVARARCHDVEFERIEKDIRALGERWPRDKRES